jgi:non-specific serine/threonine protein kinase
LLLGGYRADGQPSAAVRRLDVATQAWAPGPELPEPRAAGAAAPSGGGALYAGGVGPSGVQVEVFRLAAGAWAVAGRLPIGREHVAGAADEIGRVWVLGGRQGGLDTNQSVVDLVEGGTVRTLGQLPTARGGVAAFAWPGLGGCLVGGESPGGTHAEVECIDGNGVVRGLPDLARPRHGLGAAVFDGDAYALLGGEQPGLFVSDAVEVLKLP